MSEEGAIPSQNQFQRKKRLEVLWPPPRSVGRTFMFLKTSDEEEEVQFREIEEIIPMHSFLHSCKFLPPPPPVACSDSDSARAAARAKKEPGGITTRCVHPRLRGVGERVGMTM